MTLGEQNHRVETNFVTYCTKTFKIPYSPSSLNPAVFVRKSTCYESTSKYNRNAYPAFICAKLFALQTTKTCAKVCPPVGKAAGE